MSGDHRLYLYNDAVDIVVTTNNIYVDNRPMNNKRLQAHKGLTNTITFNIRNRDRKLQSVYTNDIVAYLVNPATRSRLLTKRLDTTNDVGIVNLYLTAGDLENINAGLYKIYITRTTVENKNMPIYSNQSNDISFDIEITEQAVLAPTPTQSVTTLLQTSNVNSGAPANAYTTSAFLGNVERNYKDAQHSVAIYPSSYTGNVKIQGSLILNTPSNDDASSAWFDIVGNISLSNESNIIHRTFIVNTNWLRVVSYPDDANSNITQVDVRN